MTRPGKPPRFRAWSPPRIKSPTPEFKQRDERGEPRDYRWTKLALKFRRANPWCKFCQQEGRDTPADVVNHIKPWREFPELRYEWKNLLSACHYHHSVIIQKLENYAREHGLLDKLPEWCADPTARPAHLRPLSAIATDLKGKQ